jgi:CheY-like chemotaxis protein
MILMDIKMPVMNGYDATRIIRQMFPHLPIIALSANAYKEDIDASFKAGMDGHISKPFRPEELLTVFHNLETEQVPS